MLRKFSVSNYRVFQDKITLDLSEPKSYEFNSECIKNGTINKAIIYGKNAVGKSNLGSAIIDIRRVLLDQKNSSPGGNFLNANSEKKEAEFEYEFLLDSYKVNYRYKKVNRIELSFEELYIDDVKMYSYCFEEKKGDFSGILEKFDSLKSLNLKKIESNQIALLKWIVNNSQLAEPNVLSRIIQFVKGISALRPNDRKIGYTGPHNGPINEDVFSSTQYIIKNNLEADLTVYLNQAGIDVKVKSLARSDDQVRLYFDYKKPVDFLLHASSGTKVLTWLFCILNFEDISFLYIDELDANLHFELSEHIIEKIKQLDKQVIITTHNTDLMSNKYLRPDCYFIMSPNDITPIYKATPRELRHGHNLEKLYQGGEFNIEN